MINYGKICIGTFKSYYREAMFQSEKQRSYNIVVMTPFHKDQVVKHLVDTYITDPVAEWMFPNPKTREKYFTKYIEAATKFGILYGTSYVALLPYKKGEEPKVIGALILMYPGFHLGFLPQLNVGVFNLIYKIPPISFIRFFYYTEFIEKTREQLAPEPHWRGCFVAVDEKYRYEGVQGDFITILRTGADLTHTACYLETAKPEIVRFYRFIGFYVQKEIVVPWGGPRVWLLKRDAK